MKDKTMLKVPIVSCVEEFAASRGVNAKGCALTIRCYLYPLVITSPRPLLKSEQKLAFEAMTLFMLIESEVREARAGWNQDRFRRLMRLRPKVVARLRRRWEILNPLPPIPLGTLRRRYHANLAGYLNESR